MRVTGFVRTCALAVVSMGGTIGVAAADEQIMLDGAGTTGSAVFALDTSASPRRIVVRTTQSGVAGSRIEVTVDKAKKPAYNHILTMEECKFGDNGSTCEIIIPASEPAYGAILGQFRRGRAGHIKVMDAGVMLLDLTAPLHDFSKTLSRNRPRR